RLCAAARPLVLLSFSSVCSGVGPRGLHSFPTRRSSDLRWRVSPTGTIAVVATCGCSGASSRTVRSRWEPSFSPGHSTMAPTSSRSEEHTSELQSLAYLVCRLLLEKKKQTHGDTNHLHAT